MVVRRTVSVKLEVDSGDVELLQKTIDTFLFVANYVVDHAWNGDSITTGKSQLHDETYHEVRELTDLQAGLVQTATRKAEDAISGVVARWESGQDAGKPHFSQPTVWYNTRSATFNDESVSLATTAGRIEADFVLPENDAGTPHRKYLRSDAFEITGGELYSRDGDWYINIHTRGEFDSNSPAHETTGHRTVLGVDLGVENLAVTSTGLFWSGAELDHWRKEYEKRRADLHQCGTRWAHQNIQSIGQTEARRFTQMIHKISNELLEEAQESDCSVIVFEDLTHIRDRTNTTWGHKWAFRRFIEYVEYKGEECGVAVERVHPENTSNRCSTCGFTDSDNRSGRSFKCRECGYANHADYNAAKNIGIRYLRHHHTGGDGGAPLGVRLNSGVLTEEREIETLPRGYTDKVAHAEAHHKSDGQPKTAPSHVNR